MQSIIDKLQTPQSFLQSVQELVIALQRTGDPGNLGKLRPHLDFLASLDPSPESSCHDWETLTTSLNAVNQIVSGLLAFIEQHQSRRGGGGGIHDASSAVANSRYKTSMCRDLSMHGSCPRGRNCTFAHSHTEIEQ
jgi:RING finger/CCCH-type zinc finger protein